MLFPTFNPNHFIPPLTVPSPSTLTTLSRFCFGLNSFSSSLHDPPACWSPRGRMVHPAALEGCSGVELMSGGELEQLWGPISHPPQSAHSLAWRLGCSLYTPRLGCSPTLLRCPVPYSAEPALPAACSKELCAAQTHKAEATCGDRERASHIHIVPCAPDKMPYLSLLIT